MKIVGLSDLPKVRVELDGARGAWKQLPISSVDGAPTFAFRVFTLEPGGHTPYHVHESEHVNYVIAGTGALVDVNGAEHAVTTGDFALVLPGEKHCYRNTSDTADFVMICAVPVAYE